MIYHLSLSQDWSRRTLDMKIITFCRIKRWWNMAAIHLHRNSMHKTPHVCVRMGHYCVVPGRWQTKSTVAIKQTFGWPEVGEVAGRAHLCISAPSNHSMLPNPWPTLQLQSAQSDNPVALKLQGQVLANGPRPGAGRASLQWPIHHASTNSLEIPFF